MEWDGRREGVGEERRSQLEAVGDNCNAERLKNKKLNRIYVITAIMEKMEEREDRTDRCAVRCFNCYYCWSLPQ